MNKHADLIEQYCQDWKETDQPWLRWQCWAKDGWDNLETHPHWYSTHLYRRKPKMITLGGIEFPEPLRETPAHGTEVFYPNNYGRYVSVYWYNLEWQLKLLRNRLIQATKEGAELQSQAMFAALRQAIAE